ncbi:S-adenosylmethionine-dependent methyltransferase [Sporothrix curviconia]|uniref:tRNA(Phe) (4-demethylwyosine(37)-C(7)) aminocarboxypropyltransferase n=1 Tax=Sporothrix curviconia TaxID=1260050 RepID=A0ABP0BZ85_9PEZI
MDVDMEQTFDDNTTSTPPPRTRHGRAHAKDGRPKKPKAESKLAAVVRRWLANVLPTLPGMPLSAGSSLLEWSVETLVAQAPKRWVVYEPMVLLPTGSFSFSTGVPSSGKSATSTTKQSPPTSPTSPPSPAPPLWQTVLAAVSREQQDQLWRNVLLALSPKGSGGANNAQLTHLAVNEGIPLYNVEGGDDENENGNKNDNDNEKDDENVLRSPTGLRPLYGDFGPATTAAGGPPTDADFQRAFWVSTKQNGLYQTWAPRWSMFSRGNIKEKARLLAWVGGPGQERNMNANGWAVDLYAGIGYFVFSYAQRGLRVLGWELNPWSAEALRRGAARNGWSVRVVRRDADLARPTADTVFCGTSANEEAGGVGDSEDREDTEDTEDTEGEYDDDEPAPIVIFVEDNQHAARRLAELQAAAASHPPPLPSLSLGPVVHVNCGLLPTSRPTWRIAWDAVVGAELPRRARNVIETDEARTAWLHLHDNVGVEELASRQAEIQALVVAWAGEVAGDGHRTCMAVVEHVEQVKTFAPGVWHCVFDVRITL